MTPSLAVLLATAAVQAQASDHVPFAEVRRILAERCYTCHGPDEAKRRGGPKGGAGLRLDTEAGLTADLGGHAAVVPGQVERSELWRRVNATDRDRMPPPGKGAALSEDERALLGRWIAQGARWQAHWADVAPTRPALPPSGAGESAATAPIDRFVRARLRREGLSPAPEADRWTLARRVALDLTGLPPTPAEVAGFVADDSPDAYARLVERLLAQPGFGERWARPWLDLARYADSAGYADDPPRTIWAWRDWVIRALNDNLPFDRFTVLQLAGDLLPDASDDHRIATAFHRNTMTNSEGGTDDEEFRCAAVVDRVSTTMAVWMGATAGCAQCHTHKYDALTHAEFFRLYAFFDQSEDADRGDEAPTLPVWSDAQLRERAAWQAELAQLATQLDPGQPAMREALAAWDAGFPRDVAWGEEIAAPITAVRVAGVARELSAAWVEPARHASPPAARFVRVEAPGKQRMLHLAEVQVFAGAVNVARRGTATQVGTGYDAPASRAIDGDTDGDFAAKSTTHTTTVDDPWWEVDLGVSQPLDRLVVWNRTDNEGVRRRLHDFRVRLLDDAREVVWEQRFATPPDPNLEVALTRALPVPLGAAYTDAGASVAIARAPRAAPEGLRLAVAVANQAAAVRVSDDARFTAYAEVEADALEALARAPGQRSAPQRGRLAAAFVATAPQFAALRARRADLERRLAEHKPHTTVPVMAERTARRTTRIHLRGNHLDPGAAVTPGTPAAFHPLPAGAPADRLALARWLVAPDNPRTARVFVNRVWAELFGTGLVATTEDFGVQGEPPSHPQLLDWLAVEFQASGYDLKALLRQIVGSATYRQRASADADLRQLDPANRLLTRGPRFRLSAEQIRDAALAASGLLSHRMYGPPVRPPRPSLGLSAAFGGSTDWTTSEGEDRHRRALYTTWRRSLPYPSMVTFDAPSREVCITQRIRTNTPLQALVTLNDPVYVEAAQALARRMSAEGGDGPAARIARGVMLCLSRPPRPGEVERLLALHGAARSRFAATPDAARAFACDPLGPAPDGTDLADLAAWTLVANVLLNLDEFLTKG